MSNVGLLLFFIYLLVMLILNGVMLISLIQPGDERNQMIVWKTSTTTLLAMLGQQVYSLIKSITHAEAMNSNPMVTLCVMATMYFIFLLYYRKKYGV